MSTFEEKLWKARLEKGWSQAELAAKIDVSGPAVSHWETGRGRPGEQNLRLLRKYLGPFDEVLETDYGRWLRETRESNEWTVADLASASGLTEPTIYNIESGRTANPTSDTRRYLENALGTNPETDQGVEDDVEESVDTGKRVFISYRRSDSGWQAKYLYKRLTEVLSDDQVFMDTDSILPGSKWMDRLKEEVYKCDVLFALIGPTWLEPQTATGTRRIDDQNDYLRVEIQQALARDILVVPVLVDGATMPSTSALPEDIRNLAGRHAVTLQLGSADQDIDRIIQELGFEDS